MVGRAAVVSSLIGVYSAFIVTGPVFDEFLYWRWVELWGLLGVSRLVFYEMTQLGLVPLTVLMLIAMGFMAGRSDLRLPELVLVLFPLYALYEPGLADLSVNLLKGFPEEYTLQLSFREFDAVVYQPLVPLYDLLRVVTGLTAPIFVARRRPIHSLAAYLAGMAGYVVLLRIQLRAEEASMLVARTYLLVYLYFAAMMAIPVIVALLFLIRGRARWSAVHKD